MCREIEGLGRIFFCASLLMHLARERALKRDFDNLILFFDGDALSPPRGHYPAFLLLFTLAKLGHSLYTQIRETFHYQRNQTEKPPPASQNTVSDHKSGEISAWLIFLPAGLQRRPEDILWLIEIVAGQAVKQQLMRAAAVILR